ncbi:NRDE family protein [Fulvivirgaceae bacterium BMA12]|uniref:NRDE family protein n=1 Tax=Agaribacillus aureus TaxID=3051825 RepID=A0ABT8L126_9BACT|nr:NRDE family protein [Fulvivirgaceae bacterium BMA12]
MCLILFSYNDHPAYKLVLAANRDEFYGRPTKNAGWWDDQPNLLGGKDLKEQGSWLAITRDGKFAAITNYRDPKHIKADAPTRGKLVTDFLLNDHTPEDYLKNLQESGSLYNGFNLIFGHQNEIFYYTNATNFYDKLAPGTYGLSNALLDTPWPKVVKGKNKFNNLLKANHDFPVEHAIKDLRDNHLAPDQELPDTGIGIEKERQLSSMFIEMSGYGTRCTTVITIDKQNEVRFKEVSYIPENDFSTSFKIS